MFKITLRDARLNSKKSLRQVSIETGISEKTLRKYERNSGLAKVNSICMLRDLYCISLNHIFIGTEEDYKKYIQELMRGDGYAKTRI